MEHSHLATDPGSRQSAVLSVAIEVGDEYRDLSARRLLIIDDQIADGDALVRMLELEGIEATCAQSGTAGLAYARAGGFDAILLDLKLPDILGMTVLSFIRAERIAIPVIVLTGHFLDTDHEEKSLQLGATAFVRKPILDAAELAAMIRRAAATGGKLRDKQSPCAVSSPPATRRLSSARRPQIPGLAELHIRAVGGDARAFEEIASLMLPVLSARLQRTFPINAAEWIAGAVEDAVLEYRAHPDRYDSTRGSSLDGYLEYNASRNVLNALDSARRRLTHETTDVAPQFWRALAVPSPEEPSERVEQLRYMLLTVRASLRPDEQLVHDLQMADEHDATVYARELHLEHLPWPEQLGRVRRIMDAVAHRVRRALHRLRDELFSNG